MRRVLVVARREYLERVRSRAFVVATIVAPLLMGGFVLVPALMASRRGNALRLSVVDASGALRPAVEAEVAQVQAGGERRFRLQPVADAPAEETQRRLKAAILSGSLDGYLYLPPEIMRTSRAEYYGKNVSNVSDLRLLERAVSEALVTARLSEQGLDPVRVKDLTRRLNLTTIRLTERGAREDRGAVALFAVVLMMMLYTTVLMWGQAVMTGVIEEKTNRVVEVVISSIPSTRLLAGKLVGIGAAGLTQFLVWAVVLSAITVSGAGAFAALGRMPEVTPLLVFCFLTFFLLGYFLYAAMFAAVGAAVNSTQEAQSLFFPVFMPLLAAMMCFPAVLQNPDSPLAVTLSLIPFLTPLLMFLRVTVLTPPLWQIALSIVLTSAAIAVVVWAAARIYRVGILMYGKRPTFPEIMRWVSRA
ncbi:MAG TPA: ABC transporter permease [Vicinamibacteria bacterium]|jgi:ABC-2 type transport system permease protein|nr:ABC transporter permease [Vicinamibacteria bacterium]